MKRTILMLVLLAVCLVTCACTQTQTPPDPSGAEQFQQPSTSATDNAPAPPPNTEDTPTTFAPEELTVELVVEWEDTDAILSRLEDMSDMLRLALEESGYSVERVTLTISTAGGFTAEALVRGGVDIAVMPAVDFLTCRKSTTGIAMSNEDICETVIALTLHNGLTDSTLCTALFDALTATEQGKEFLAICRPGTVFTIPTEEAMQAVQDWIEQQETMGGHTS